MPHLCSSANYANTMEGEAVVFQQKNPAFASFTKVYVPYCSSDEHSGDRQASPETGNFHFNGRNIVTAVVDELHARGMIGQSGNKVVLAGASAGGAGAAKNCDFVADKINGLGYNAKVSCLLDGLDLEPTWLTSDCNLVERRTFWNAQQDSTCLQALGNEVANCSSFSLFWSYIETPFMVVSSEADQVTHFCNRSPSLVDNSVGSFGRRWREGMAKLGQEMVDTGRADIGVFLGNCPFHIAMENSAVFSEMPVTVVGQQGNKVTLSQAILNWMAGQGPYHAIDNPAETNPMCSKVTE